ncbi:MAG: hypothetical protein ACM3X3_11665 [Betaproteobacteria bacterium]
MRRLIAGVLAVLLCACTAGCFGTPRSRYTIILQHDWSAPASSMSTKLAARPITPSEDLGHVIVDDPWWETNGWYAWVIVKDEAGNIIDKPPVEWTTDIPECIRIVYYMPDGRTDLVLVTAFPGSAMGKGKLYAKYGNATASMTVVAYGPRFELERSDIAPTSDGWSVARRAIVDRSEADFWLDTTSTSSPALIKAPNGVKQLGDRELMYGWGYFEPFVTPSEEGLTSEVPLVGGVYEIVARDGTHYKIADLGTRTESSGLSWKAITTFTWAPFW